MTRAIPTNHRFAVVVAVNDDAVLANCLMRSPDLSGQTVPIHIFRGYSSAGRAYNDGIAQCEPGTIVIFAHQDVYLPRGFLDRLTKRIDEIEENDENWGVLGLIGLTRDGALAGRVWSTAWDREFKGSGPLPVPISTADELLVVARVGESLSLDPDLPSFHLFATDMILTAMKAGRTSYAIDCPVVHHDKVIRNLGGTYPSSYRYMVRKWRHLLPVPNLVVPLERTWLSWLRADLRQRWGRRNNPNYGPPMTDPSMVADALGWE